MKKFWALLTLVVMSFVLASCGDKPKATDDEAAAEDDATEQPADQAE